MHDPIAPRAPSGGPLWPALALLVAFTLPFWQPPLLAHLQLRTPDSRRLAELALTVDRLGRQVDELQTQLREATGATASARADANAATDVARAAQARLSTLALIQLSVALRHPDPFETELAMVWAASGGASGLSPLLEQVRSYAAFGIPALPQLRREFSALAGQFGWNGSHLAWLARLVGLSAPAASPDATATLVQQVRDLLAEENLAGALAVARQLPDSARAKLSDWLDDAAARVAADELGRDVATLAGQSGGASP